MFNVLWNAMMHLEILNVIVWTEIKETNRCRDCVLEKQTYDTYFLDVHVKLWNSQTWYDTVSASFVENHFLTATSCSWYVTVALPFHDGWRL